MTTYIKGVLGCIFLLDLFCLIAPNGKIGKTVESAFKLMCIVVLLSPIAFLFGEAKPDIPFSQEIVVPIDHSFEEMAVSRLIYDNFSEKVNVQADDTRIIVYKKEREKEEEIRFMLSRLYAKEIVFVYETA